MKKTMIFRKLASLLLIGGLLGSCSEDALDNVNFDKDHPHDVQAKFILTDAITSTAFSSVGGDFSLYASVYIEHEAGVWNQLYNAETRIGEPTVSSTFNNGWGSTYETIRGLKEIILKTSEGGSEEGNNVTGGIAKVLLAYNIGLLTDLFGDVPYYQSAIFKEDGTPMYMQPAIDKQADLYAEIQKLLDEAIADLPKGDENIVAGLVGSQDLIYKGSASLWVKAAYGLKARYLMHTLYKSSDRNGDLNKIIDYVSKSFADSSEELAFKSYDGSANINPLFGISYARDMQGVSKSLAEKFKTLNDPRGDQAFMDYDFVPITIDEAVSMAAPNGECDQVQFEYPISMAEYGPTTPTLLLSYHEVMFLKAEAEARLGKTANAQASLENAIVAAFANLERSLNSTNDYWGLGAAIDLSQGVASDYFNNSVLTRFNTNPVKEVMLQKYLAFYGASGESTEAYSDYRRLRALGEGDYITLANPSNAKGRFPLRFPYGSSDVIANRNIKEAYGNGQYVYTENVWWAGGNR